MLGIWSGQTFLSPGKSRHAKVSQPQSKIIQSVAKKSATSKKRPVTSPAVKAVSAPKINTKEVAQATKKAEVEVVPEPEADPAFFAVQVGAFMDAALAAKEVLAWHDKGYKSFSRSPAGVDDKFTRVYIGRYDSMEAAKKKAAALAESGKIKPFIVLVPAE